MNDTLRAEARELIPDLERAQEIARKAERAGRNMTAAELSIYQAAMSKAEPVLAKLKAARQAREASRNWADLDELRALGGPATATDASRRLSFRGMGRTIASRMLGPDGLGGRKSIAPSGVDVVAQSFVGDPIALGRPATGLLDLLPVRQQPSPSFAYMRQVERVNRAAVTPEGELKPTSDIGLERVDAVLQVVATLSQESPKYWFEDVGALEQFVENELRANLAVAVEALVIETINETSGVQEQAYSTSPIETLRKSITLLEVAGHQPLAALLHPTDWERVELLLTSTTAVERQGIPFDAALRRLFGLVVATSVGQTPGTAHVIGGPDVVVLDTDTAGVQVQWSENAGAETFARNNAVLRVEGRYHATVQAPAGVVLADVSGDGS
jgi:HK97 family phage major capsid protein